MNGELNEKIIRILAEVRQGELQTDELNGNSSIVNDVGLDSLQMIDFMLKVEEEFEITMDFDNFDFSTLDSIQTFSDYIAGAK